VDAGDVPRAIVRVRVRDDRHAAQLQLVGSRTVALVEGELLHGSVAIGERLLRSERGVGGIRDEYRGARGGQRAVAEIERVADRASGREADRGTVAVCVVAKARCRAYRCRLGDDPRRVESLGIKKAKPNGSKPISKIPRRLEKIDQLRPQQQATLLRTIDTFLRGAAK